MLNLTQIRKGHGTRRAPACLMALGLFLCASMDRLPARGQEAGPRYAITALGELVAGGGSEPRAINDESVVVGQATVALNGSDTVAFLWRNALMDSLGNLGTGEASAEAINDSGQIVGWAIDDQGQRFAFHGDASGIQQLASDAEAYGNNNLGHVVGGAGSSAFFWKAGAPLALLGTLRSNNQGFAVAHRHQRWRAVDANGNEGPWSESRFFTVFGGVDLAYPTPSQDWWSRVRAGGWSFFIANAWKGHGRSPNCETNLRRARKAGLFTAAYCLLNFDNGSTVAGAPADQDGHWQVKQALGAIGTQKRHLHFMAIDVEDAWKGTMTQAERVRRICEALAETRRAKLRPVIYTRNTTPDPAWTHLTGNSTVFGHLPLWAVPRILFVDDARDDLELDEGQPWRPYGGWTQPVGKQFALSDTGTTLFGEGVDLNVFDPAFFAGTDPATGPTTLEVAALPERVGDEILVTVVVENSGTTIAECVEVTTASLHGPRKRRGVPASTPVPVSLPNIAPGQAKQAALAFPGASAPPGGSGLLRLQVRHGGEVLRLRIQLVLP